MLFLYILSLLHLSLLTTSQTLSESEEMNRIIGSILSQAEKKNAEPIKYSWMDKVTAKGPLLPHEVHYKDSRSAYNDKIFDQSPEAFLRTKAKKISPSLRLKELIEAFNKIHTQTTDVFDRNYDTTKYTHTTKSRKANHSKKTRTRYKNRVTTPMVRWKKKVKQTDETTSRAMKTTISSKAEVGTSTLLNDGTRRNSRIIPSEPHDRQFSASIFHASKPAKPATASSHFVSGQVSKETTRNEIEKSTTLKSLNIPKVDNNFPQESIKLVIPKLKSAPHEGVKLAIPEVESTTPQESVKLAIPEVESTTPQESVKLAIPEVESTVPQESIKLAIPEVESTTPRDSAKLGFPEFEGPAAPQNSAISAISVVESTSPQESVKLTIPEFESIIPQESINLANPKFESNTPQDSGKIAIPEFEGTTPQESVKLAIPEVESTTPQESVKLTIPEVEIITPQYSTKLAFPEVESTSPRDSVKLAVPEFEDATPLNSAISAIPVVESTTPQESVKLAIPEVKSTALQESIKLAIPEFESTTPQDSGKIAIPEFEGTTTQNSAKLAIPGVERSKSQDSEKLAIPKVDSNKLLKNVEKPTPYESEKSAIQELESAIPQKSIKLAIQEIEEKFLRGSKKTFTDDSRRMYKQKYEHINSFKPDITKTSHTSVIGESPTHKVITTSTRLTHKPTSRLPFRFSTFFNMKAKDLGFSLKKLKNKFYYFDDEDEYDNKGVNYITPKAISAKEWIAIDHLEDLINSIPNYHSPRKSFSDYTKRIPAEAPLRIDDKATAKYNNDQEKNSGEYEKEISLPPLNKQSVEKKRKVTKTNRNVFPKTITFASFFDPDVTFPEDRASMAVNDPISTDLYILVDHKDNLIKGFYALKSEKDKTSTKHLQRSTNSEGKVTESTFDVETFPSSELKHEANSYTKPENVVDSTGIKQDSEEAEVTDGVFSHTIPIQHKEDNAEVKDGKSNTCTSTENNVSTTAIKHGYGKPEVNGELSTLSENTSTTGTQAATHNNKSYKNKDIADLYKEIGELYGNAKAEGDGENKVQQKNQFINWDKIKKFFGHDRVCSCKCRANRTVCKVCAASDAVIRELTFEFNNLANYMNEHCTEIQTFFWMNPSGGKKLRDAVHKIDKSMYDYYKRVKGKCAGRTCKTFATYLDKRNYDKQKKVDKRLLQDLLRELNQLHAIN